MKVIKSLELKAEMVRKGITAYNLAKMLGISNATLSYKLNNLIEFKSSEIKGIQQALGLTDGQRDYIFFEFDVDLKSTN